MFKKNRKSKKNKSFISKKKSIKNNSKKGGDGQQLTNNEIYNQLQEAILYIINPNNIENIRYRQLIHKQSLLKDPDNKFTTYNNYYGILRDYLQNNNADRKSNLIKIYDLEDIFYTIQNNLSQDIQSEIQNNLDFFKKKKKDLKDLKVSKKELQNTITFSHNFINNLINPLGDGRKQVGLLNNILGHLDKLHLNKKKLLKTKKNNFKKIINISLEENFISDFILGKVIINGINPYLDESDFSHIYRDEWINDLEQYKLNNPIFIAIDNNNEATMVQEYLEDWRKQYNNASDKILGFIKSKEITLQFYSYLLHTSYRRLKLDNILANLIYKYPKFNYYYDDLYNIDSISFFYKDKRNLLVQKSMIEYDELIKIQDYIDNRKSNIELFLKYNFNIINIIEEKLNQLTKFLEEGTQVFTKYKIYNKDLDNTKLYFMDHLESLTILKQNIKKTKENIINVEDLYNFKNKLISIAKSANERLTV